MRRFPRLTDESRIRRGGEHATLLTPVGRVVAWTVLALAGFGAFEALRALWAWFLRAAL